MSCGTAKTALPTGERTSPGSTGCGGETRKTCCAQCVGEPGAVESVTGLGAGEASLPLNCTSNQPPKPESSASSWISTEKGALMHLLRGRVGVGVGVELGLGLGLGLGSGLGQGLGLAPQLLDVDRLQ